MNENGLEKGNMVHTEYFSTNYFEKKLGGEWEYKSKTIYNHKKRSFTDKNQIIEFVHESWIFDDDRQALSDHDKHVVERSGIEEDQKYSIMVAVDDPPSPIDEFPLVFVSRGPSDTVKMMLSVAASSEIKDFEKVCMVYCQQNVINKVSVVVRDPEHQIHPMSILVEASKYIKRMSSV
ncbi:DNA ligase [Acrasis kona]|uniref:DNA ligase n=1 Tax=Acrasis kona TaxID=1008807 RepID=A0AAW2ZT61_9EUKA